MAIFDKSLKSKLISLFSTLPIDAVYLYGSQALQNSDSFSDYDFGILFSASTAKKQKWDLTLKLFSDLAKILHTSEDNVDVVNAETAPSLLQFNIICGQRIYTKNPTAYVFFETDVMARYQDNHYYYDKWLKSTLEKVAKGVYFERRISYP